MVSTDTDTSALTKHEAYAALAASLESWRYFALMLCPPLGWTLLKAPGLSQIVLLAAIAPASVLVWRLWLDARLFSHIDWTRPEAERSVGQALSVIWQRPALRSMSPEARWQGASRLLRLAGYGVALVWSGWLVIMLLLWAT